MNTLRIGYLGSCLRLVNNPMRGQWQSIMTHWGLANATKVESIYINSYRDLNQNMINSLDILVYPMDKYYDREFFDKWTEFDYSKTVLAGYSLELTDCFNRASIYEFFNQVTQPMLEHWYRSKLNEVTELLIGTGGSAPEKYNGKYFQYPYYLAPSIFAEDKLELMFNLIEKNPCIGFGGRLGDICMVYQRTNRYRDRIADFIDIVTGNKITYSGKWRNNDKSIPFTYDYNIVNDYYTNYKFNVVVENDYQPGWVTEKIVNPLIAGCVPIYFDPFNQFPDWILNREACMILNYNNMNSLTCLEDIDATFNKYKGKPVFVENASKNLIKWMNSNIEIINSVLTK